MLTAGEALLEGRSCRLCVHPSHKRCPWPAGRLPWHRAAAGEVQSEREDGGGCLLAAMAAPVGAGPLEEAATCTALLAPASQQESRCCCQLWKSFPLADNTDLCVGARGRCCGVRVRGSYRNPFCCTTNARPDITSPYSFLKAVVSYTTAEKMCQDMRPGFQSTDMTWSFDIGSFSTPCGTKCYC